MASKVSDATLKEMLKKSQSGIAEHTATLKGLLEASGEKVNKDHCTGMEGLVAETTRHTTDQASDKATVLDAVIIAQYQRMTHDTIAGFGTATSYAGTLGLKDMVKALKQPTKEI